jgi:hypothetical protein
VVLIERKVLRVRHLAIGLRKQNKVKQDLSGEKESQLVELFPHQR